MQSSAHEVTQLLRVWSEGDHEALDKLTPLVYDELHRAAHRYMAQERPCHTLQTTALVNEVYLRLVDIREVTWQDRAHFFAVCARLMRRVLTDFARSRRYLKRGGDSPHVALDQALRVPRAASRPRSSGRWPERPGSLRPEEESGGGTTFLWRLSVDETAEVLKVSPKTVDRDWKLARLWLLQELNGKRHDGR